MYFLLAVSGPSDRFGPRWVSVFGMLVMGAGMASSGLRPALTWFTGASDWVLGSGLVSRMCRLLEPCSRGLLPAWICIRLAVSGIGVGALGPLLASALIESIGWRQSFILMGVAAALGVAAATFLENKPEQRKVCKTDLPPRVAPAPIS